MIGRIRRSHGLRGEVRVYPETDFPERFGKLEQVYIGPDPTRARPMRVERVRLELTHRLPVVLKLAGVLTRTQADTLVGMSLYIPEEELWPLPEDKVYIHDILGAQVETEDGQYWGQVQDVLRMPAQDVYQIRRPDGRLVLLPAVEAFVLEVDVQRRRLLVRPPEGLLDL
ncbi:MAG: ribosome maturation factor RimM [Bacteroidetes bacterium]|nr:ribosome maturation factor RimM [Rhodothermia bacterium]MCX7906059.1 ribosome maturation factor RimM [Bacteroidota bacterium]